GPTVVRAREPDIVNVFDQGGPSGRPGNARDLPPRDPVIGQQGPVGTGHPNSPGGTDRQAIEELLGLGSIRIPGATVVMKDGPVGSHGPTLVLVGELDG